MQIGRFADGCQTNQKFYMKGLLSIACKTFSLWQLECLGILDFLRKWLLSFRSQPNASTVCPQLFFCLGTQRLLFSVESEV